MKSGCLGCLGFLVIALIFTSCVSLFVDDDEYESDESESIEYDYNGDGEQDAEDWRIQQEGE